MVYSLLEQKLINSPFLYREQLTIPRNVNFGLELELDKINPDEVYSLVRKQMGGEWKVKSDKSLTVGENSEIVSPILQNTKDTWIMLKKMSELLKKLNPNYDNCSFQINFDGDFLETVDDKVRFLKLFATYEDIIYRFSKGEDRHYRESLEKYAAPIILMLKDGVMFFDDETTVDVFSNNKRYGVVFKTDRKNLIEFRTPNMTNNPLLWQNYITMFYYLLEYAASNKCDKKILDEYIRNYSKIYVLENYELDRREKACKFSDMIFNNSVDKINFMHQYLGEEGPKKYVLK